MRVYHACVMYVLIVIAVLLNTSVIAQKGDAEKKKPTLRLAVSYGPQTLTPLLSNDQFSSQIQSQVLDSLAIRESGGGTWKPGLASSWEIRGNGKRIVFQLAEGLKFSDGEPLTAEDVVFTWQLAMNENLNAPRMRVYYSAISKVSAVGDDKVVFIFKESSFNNMAIAGGMWILPKHHYEKYTIQQLNDSKAVLMGSGRYRMLDAENYQPGKEITLVLNPNYHGEKPAIERIIWRPIRNETARTVAFKAGELDVLSILTMDYKRQSENEALLKGARLYNYLSPTAGYTYIGWNQVDDNGAPSLMADKRVRQALTYLVPRQTIVDRIYFGQALVACGPFMFGGPQAHPDLSPRRHDVVKAMALLAKAGFVYNEEQKVMLTPDGKPWAIGVIYPSGSKIYDPMFKLIKKSFAEAGIKLNLEPLDWGLFLRRLKAKDFEAASLGWSGGIETDIAQMFHSEHPGTDNFVSYTNKELDKVIDQAHLESDVEKRMKLWHKAHELLYEDQPYTFLVNRESNILIKDRIKGVEIKHGRLNEIHEWSIEE